MTSGAAALGVHAVSHRFGDVLAVDSADLTVSPGEVLCLVGPSGCGKTTLLRLIAGLETLQSGHVELDGRTVATPEGGEPPENRNVGLVFQDFALFPHLNIADNVAFGLRRKDRGQRDARVATALAEVGMSGYATAYPDQLSGGQQQRVALARALLPRPRLMLLDEPFSGLDARLRDLVRDQTLHILKDSNATSLLVTHDPEEAMFMADRIAVMNDGAILQVGAPRDLYFHPKDQFVAAFFSDVNALTCPVSAGQVSTPFGGLTAVDGLNGAGADVLIRPEGISLNPNTASHSPGGRPLTCAATVEAAHFLGRSSLIHLTVDDPQGPLHLHARVPGCVLPPAGRPVTLHLDPSLAFVFPATDVT